MRKGNERNRVVIVIAIVRRLEEVRKVQRDRAAQRRRIHHSRLCVVAFIRTFKTPSVPTVNKLSLSLSARRRACGARATWDDGQLDIVFRLLDDREGLGVCSLGFGGRRFLASRSVLRPIGHGTEGEQHCLAHDHQPHCMRVPRAFRTPCTPLRLLFRAFEHRNTNGLMRKAGRTKATPE